MININFQKKFWTCPRTCNGESEGHVPDTDKKNNNINIYFNLFNIYKRQIEKKPFYEKVKIISDCQNNKQYQNLPAELQEKIFMELMKLK